jgi:lysophospholipase L1-like esterase
MRVLTTAILLALLVAPAAARAQAQYRSSVPGPAPSAVRLEPRLETYRQNAARNMIVDFAQQYVYAAANRALPPPARGERRVVFLGDSITDSWNLEASFPARPYVNRGISGQVTPQMLVRFHADVVALKPAAVVILAGVNDTAGVIQTQTDDEITANYEAMAELAEAHGIKPIFTKILPVNRYDHARKVIDDSRDPAHLQQLNAWLAAFCARRGYVLIDYGPALSGPDGQLREDYSRDGLHPNAAGYAVMAPIAQKAIEAALGR